MSLSSYECILFDFDGVIIDSMPIRDEGFRETLSEFDEKHVEALIQFHHENGGLSRYVKFRHFYENILDTEVSEEWIQELADRFSHIMREKLTDKRFLIGDTIEFIQQHSNTIPFYIVSGSDQEELRYLCEKLGIYQHFIGIFGSPTPKIDLVAHVLATYGHDPKRAVLIGDSVNDREAARANDVTFYGYNNEALRENGDEAYLRSLWGLSKDSR